MLLYYILPNISPFLLFSLFLPFTEKVISSGRAFDLWSGGVRFETRHGYRLTCWRPLFLYLSSSQQISRWRLRLSRDFLPSTDFIFRWQITLAYEAIEHVLRSRDHVFSIRSRLRDGRSGVRVFSFLILQTGTGVHLAFLVGFFPRRRSSRGEQFTTHLHLVPRVSGSDAILLLHLYAFTTWVGKNILF